MVFLLKSDNASTYYSWVSSENDQSAWPALDVTWSAPPVDITPPSAPTELALEAFDAEDSSAAFTLSPGYDSAGPNGAEPSGIAKNRGSVQARARSVQRHGQELPADYVLVPDVAIGDGLTFEARSTDANGNVSIVTTAAFSVAPRLWLATTSLRRRGTRTPTR